MSLEIEKRANINEKEFDKLKKYLETNAEKIKEREMKTFLFKDPSYLRLRLIKNKDKAIITHKEGTYFDTFREETDIAIDKNDSEKFVKILKSLGFKECLCLESYRISFRFNEMLIDMSKISDLGLFVEVEAITEHEEEVKELNEKVKLTLKKLNLKEQSPEEYQNMLNEAYKHSKPIEKHKFSI